MEIIHNGHTYILKPTHHELRGIYPCSIIRRVRRDLESGNIDWEFSITLLARWQSKIMSGVDMSKLNKEDYGHYFKNYPYEGPQGTIWYTLILPRELNHTVKEKPLSHGIKNRE